MHLPIALIQCELQKRHSCHTVILYGSYARGDATETSDIDVIGIREHGDVRFDARLFHGVYLDAFICSEEHLADPPELLLDMKAARILCQKEDMGTRLLQTLTNRLQKGPKLLRSDEIQVIQTWRAKTLARIRKGGLAGNFRRAEFLPEMLKHLFITRGQWYPGHKAAFQWMEKERPELFHAFSEALAPGAPLSALENVASLVDEVISKEAKPLDS